MRRFRRVVSSRLLFIVPTAANGLVTLLTIPAVLHAAGAAAWTAIALGQAVGGVAMTVVAFGWSISGPAEVGRLAPAERSRLFSLVVVARSVIALPVLALSALISVLLPGGSGLLAPASAVATAVIGMNSVWYFVGTGQPGRLLVYDTAPRTLAVVLGLVLLLSGWPVIVLLALQLGGVLLGVVLSWWAVAGRAAAEHLRRLTPREVAAALRAQTDGVGFNLLNAFVTYLPLPIVAIVAPQAAGAFAVIDKVQKQLATAAVPFGNMVVASMAQRLRGASGDEHTAARRSALEAFVVAGCCAVGTVVVAAGLAAWLSLGTVVMTPLLAGCIGLTVAATFLSRTLPAAALAPVGRVRVALHSGLVGLALLVPATVLGARPAGALGAEVALTATMCAIVLVQVVGLVRPARRFRVVPGLSAR